MLLRGGMMQADIAKSLSEWASRHEALAAMWLFGSRAQGTPRPESDHDIALELVPKRNGDDWAFTSYFFSRDRWKREIESIIEGPINLVCYRADLDCKFDPRVIKIWSRPEPLSRSTELRPNGAVT